MSKKDKNDQNEDIVIEGHTYDGIKEYDNPMPRWWVNLFWATIIFSIGYCAYYMTGWGPSHLEEYKRELKLAELKYRKKDEEISTSADELSISERLLLAAKDQDSIAQGKTIYDTRCMPCHGDKGQGVIGPNLTDEYWIHGGTMEEILHIINVGVPQKGMIAWEGQLSEEERIALVAYLRSIQGTKVPGKAQEGEFAEADSLD